MLLSRPRIFFLMMCAMGLAVGVPQTLSPQVFARRIPAPQIGGPLEQTILHAATKYGIHPALIAAIIEVESAWNPYARSPKGAMGLMQLMPETARRMGVMQPFDIASNINGGVKYFRQMLDLFRGNYLLALSAYNAGPGAVQRYGTIPPFSETVHYLPKVAYWYRHYALKMDRFYGKPATPTPPVAKEVPRKGVRPLWSKLSTG